MLKPFIVKPRSRSFGSSGTFMLKICANLCPLWRPLLWGLLVVKEYFFVIRTCRMIISWSRGIGCSGGFRVCRHHCNFYSSHWYVAIKSGMKVPTSWRWEVQGVRRNEEEEEENERDEMAGYICLSGSTRRNQKSEPKNPTPLAPRAPSFDSLCCSSVLLVCQIIFQGSLICRVGG